MQHQQLDGQWLPQFYPLNYHSMLSGPYTQAPAVTELFEVSLEDSTCSPTTQSSTGSWLKTCGQHGVT